MPDFAAGAMENAGAITFRERLLLADEATASVDVRKVGGVGDRRTSSRTSGSATW